MAEDTQGAGAARAFAATQLVACLPPSNPAGRAIAWYVGLRTSLEPLIAAVPDLLELLVAG